VQPLVAGIYVADGRRLSLAATMPEFLEAERNLGSLRRAAARQGAAESAARYGAFVTLRGGMSRLVEALADQLQEDFVALKTPVAEVARTTTGQWTLTHGDDARQRLFDGVIIAAPAPQAARLLERFDPQLSQILARIEYASSAVVTLLHDRNQITRPLDAFGFVVPEIENRPIIAASFPGVKFPHACPPERAPIRVFLGGALRPELVNRSDEELTAISHEQLEELLGLHGPPLAAQVARWRDSMPQYHVGHVELVSAIDERVASHPRLELAGNAYHGVGIPQCIKSGRLAAEKLSAAGR
jgi:oxygen-dependent protoporphyrinogen oxidase